MASNMTDDDKALVERLRKAFWLREDDYDTAGGFRDTAPREAADRIEALSAENERLQLLCDLNAVPAGIIEDRGRMEERAAIVAWLRGGGKRRSLADWIEAGEHLK